MLCSGVGALMTSDCLIHTLNGARDDLLFFVPSSPDARRTLYIASKRGVRRTPVAENFIRTAEAVCRRFEK